MNDPDEPLAITLDLLPKAPDGFHESIAAMDRRALAAALRPTFLNARRGRKLWLHGLATAEWAYELARRVGGAGPGEIFLVGLLHDIGIVAFHHIAPDRYARVLETAKKEKSPLTEVEERCLGTTHPQLATAVCGLWRLPPRVASALAHHHRPTEASRGAQILRVADWLASSVGLRNFRWDEYPRPDTELEALGLGNEQVEALQGIDPEIRKFISSFD